MDRAALDFAIARGLPHGGWCPAGRAAEDGAIPRRYRLKETPSPTYVQRTEWNVRDSNGTVIFTVSEEMFGGSQLTAEFAKRHGKPWRHLSRRRDEADAAQKLLTFVREHGITILNVAGPRASTEPEAAVFAHAVLQAAFGDEQKPPQ